MLSHPQATLGRGYNKLKLLGCCPLIKQGKVSLIFRRLSQPVAVKMFSNIIYR
jgi:hypothetical protein